MAGPSVGASPAGIYPKWETGSTGKRRAGLRERPVDDQVSDVCRSTGRSRNAARRILLLLRLGLSRLLRHIQLSNGLGLGHQPIPVLLYVLRRSAFGGDGMGDLRRLDHVDRIPGAPPLAERTADAPVQVDVTERLQRRLVLARQLVDAVY